MAGEGTIIMEDSSSKQKHSDTGKAQNLVVEGIVFQIYLLLSKAIQTSLWMLTNTLSQYF